MLGGWPKEGLPLSHESPSAAEKCGNEIVLWGSITKYPPRSQAEIRKVTLQREKVSRARTHLQLEGPINIARAWKSLPTMRWALWKLRK